MTPVSFVKTTESNEISLVTINQQTSYDSGILRQDYEFVRGLSMNHTRYPYGQSVYGNGPKRGRPNYRIGPDGAGRAYLQ